MNIPHLINRLVGLFVFMKNSETPADRGLSQSAENAILLAGAVAVASGIIAAITVYVQSHMPK